MDCKISKQLNPVKFLVFIKIRNFKINNYDYMIKLIIGIKIVTLQTYL